MIAALFFSSESPASIDDPESCAQTAVPLVRCVAVGVLSCSLSAVSVRLLTALTQRGFVHAEGWTDSRQRLSLMAWRLLDVVCFLAGLLYMLFAMAYVGLFLA